MPRTRKSVLPRNLNTYDVYIEDRSPTSDYFRISNLPSVFTGGRNSFLLGGSSFLKNRSDILIEILDINGKTVYNGPISDYLESKSKLISVEVYDNTPVGFGTIIIMGVAAVAADGTPIPDEWRDKYNVRWSSRILIDGNVPNVSPIRFLNTPEAFVNESLLNGIVTASYTITDVPFTASLSPMLFSSIHSGYTISASGATTFSAEYFGAVLTGSVASSGVSTTIHLPITSILNSSTAFSSGHLLTIGNSQVRSMVLYSASYATNVDNKPTLITSTMKLRKYVLNAPTLSVKSSFANLRIANLKTVSGELYKVRVYAKPTTDFADYKLVGDVLVGTSELLTSSSIRGAVGIGNFVDTPNFNDNWYAGELATNTGQKSAIYRLSGSAEYYIPPVSPSITLSLTDSILLRSIRANVQISGNTFSGSAATNGYFIGTRNKFTLFPTTEYTLTFDAYYKEKSGELLLEGNAPRVDIYLTGDIIDENPLGQRIGRIEPSGTTRWYQSTQFNFSPAVSSQKPLGLRFVVTNGFWHFSNISIKAASETLFSPDEVSLIIPNTEYRNKVMQYKVEFFDINNNSANIEALATPTFFTGSAIDLGTFL